MAYVLFLSGKANAEMVGVLYPEIREPYKQIFLNITEGIEEIFPRQVESFAIANDDTPLEIQSWLLSKDITDMVALGRAGVDSLKNLNLKIPVTIGAVIVDPENLQYTGITQNASPEILFRNVKELFPELSIVHVVYESRSSNWVIEQASLMAQGLGIELKVVNVSNLREAAEAYSNIQKKMDATTEALWLPVGAPTRDSSILQNVLALAWKRNLVVFSSNLADVRRGVLFSMYPDNKGMGKELGKLLLEQRQNPDQENRILFLTSLFRAINVRTAEHIGLKFSRKELNDFNYVYPPL